MRCLLFADFHSLVAAHGDVYGCDSASGRFMVSSDGKEWETRGVRTGVCATRRRVTATVMNHTFFLNLLAAAVPQCSVSGTGAEAEPSRDHSP